MTNLTNKALKLELACIVVSARRSYYIIQNVSLKMPLNQL